MTKRRLLSCLMISLLGLFVFAKGAIAQNARKPNVVVIIGDDHAAYVTGAYGNPQARTPNLDRLASQGVLFSHAYCNSPVCTPSRQSLLTGMLPHTTGVTQLTTALSDSTFTLAELLGESGYETAAIGKMHFNSSLHHGFELRLDHAEHLKHLAQHPPEPIAADIEVLPVWKPFQDPARIWLNGSYLPYKAHYDEMQGTWFARQAAAYIQENKQKPFLLFVGFTTPHSPFHFPVEYKDMHNPDEFQVPAIGPEDDWQVPEIFRDLTVQEKQRIIASYYTSTAFHDRNVGEVLEAIDGAGLKEETLVIYLGDNGYSLGQHGRFEKHCLYEPAVRVPLMMRMEGVIPPGRSLPQQTELIDLFPTVAEFCGAAPPPQVQGRSLAPMLRGEPQEGREMVFVEYLENEEAMIRTPKFKFIYGSGKRLREDGYKTGRPLPGQTRILFDLEKDPEEMVNLAARPEHQEMIQNLEKEMLRRFESVYPLDASEIAHVTNIEDRLDWHLKPRDKK